MSVKDKLTGHGEEMLRAWREAGDLGGYPGLIGFRVDAFSPGRARIVCPVLETHANLAGAVHGGVFAGLMDSVTGIALVTLLAEGEGFVTADLHTRYLGGAPADGRMLAAEAEIVKKGRTLAVAEGQVTLAEDPGAVYARATASMVIRSR